MADQPPTPPARSRTGGGLPMGRPFGVPVFVSPSWLLVAAYITLTYATVFERTVGGSARYLVSFAFAVLLYLSVFAHELSHCVVSIRLGLPIRRITIFLLGGVSEIEKEPETAGREYLVAVAGPLMSLLLGGMCLGAVPIFGRDTVPRELAFNLGVANTLLAFFNLLPGLPLDGGRVLRAGVWRLSHSRVTGTRAAAYAGRAVAVAVFALPLVSSLGRGQGEAALGTVIFAALVATFIWAGATQALRGAEISSRLPRLAVRHLVRRPLSVTADVPVAEALRRAAAAGAHGLVVVDGSGTPDALVSEAAVQATPEQRRPWVSVGTLARRLGPGLVLDADLAGSAVLEAMRSTPASEYLVVERTGAVVGVLASVDVARALELESAGAR